jgi:uncharacterized membrane protein YfcA
MIMQEIGAIAAALGIGLSLGLIGAGGSILTIPAFVYILKVDPLSSSIYAMFVVGISSLAGAVQAIVNKLVDIKTTLLFGIPSMAGVLVARKLLFPAIPSQLFFIGSLLVTKEMLFMFCLAALMLFAAVRMLQPVATRDDHAVEAKPAIALLVVRGMLVGVITGLLGVGGGFLVVPALYFWAKLPVKKSIGTALIIICSNCLFSFWSSYHSLAINWILLLKFSVIAIAGILIGTRLSAQLNSAYLKKIFGWFILATSFYMLYKTIAPISEQLY